MLRTIVTALFCSVFLLAQSRGQDVFVPRQLKAIPVPQSEKGDPPESSSTKVVPEKEPVAVRQAGPTESVRGPVKEPTSNLSAKKTQSAKTEPENVQTAKVPMASPRSVKTELAKAPAVKESPAKAQLEKVQTAKAEPVKVPGVKESPVKPQVEKVQTARVEPTKAPAMKEPSTDSPPEKIEVAKLTSVKMPPTQEPTADIHLLSSPVETASTRLADGFDFPVGKPEAEGYYKARGFRPGGHVGEDWDGVRGGDTDFKDPIYCIGDGVVVFARDVHRGWGNVVIVRHGYRENGGVKYIDSLYGHLNTILVKRCQKVARGQQIGTMGTAHGQYDAHLHLEIRKNIEIGMSRAKFERTFSNYYDPSQFIVSHRHLAGGGVNFRVAMNTFTHDSAYHFDDSPSFSARRRSTAESSAALARAISSTTH